MANPDIISQLLHELAVGVSEVRWVNYTLVPGITLMVYDWLITLDLEVSLVWNSPWSVTKVAYLLTRYLPFFDISLQACYQLGRGLPLHVCKVLYNVPAWSFLIGHSLATLILTMRTWAVCKKEKKLTYILFGVFGAIVTAGFVFVGLYLASATFQVSPIPQVVGCIAEAKGSYLASLYVLMMFFEASLLMLMIAQGISTFRRGGGSNLTRVIYRDGILYYVYMFGLSLVNTVIIFRLQGAFVALLVAIERVTYSVLACRVVLHIREQGQTDKALLTPSEEMTGSLRFGPVQRMSQVVTGASEEVGGRV